MSSTDATIRTAVVTGASDGIGLECATQLAEQGFRVVVVGRNPDKTAAALARIRAISPESTSLIADFASLDQVRRVAAEILQECPRIDVLVSNAGGVAAKRTLTEDGHEWTFGVNHLAGFLLIDLLKQRLIDSAPARIVITASVGYKDGTMDFDDLGFAKGYTIMRAYSRSKLANVLHTRQLAKELAGTGVIVNTLHPGAVATSIWSGAPAIARPFLKLGKLFMDSPADGGQRLTFLATDPSVTTSGEYYEKNHIKQLESRARDEQTGQRLVEVSRQLVDAG